MKLISHRGNLTGPIKEKENHPEYIISAINSGFDCEIDVWYIDNQFYLGHDSPEYKIKIDFLMNNKLWCHAKNLLAFHNMLNHQNIHCFWHQTDDFTLTSNGYIWTYPNKELCEKSICITHNFNINDNIKKCFGICSDIIQEYKNL